MSVSSPKVMIRSQLPWPMRIFLFLLSGALGATLMWFYDTGRMLPGKHTENVQEQIERYRAQVEKLTMERDQLSATANSGESKLNMEHAAQKQLAAQVRTLEADNMRLKEDLAFFESLLPNATGPQGVSIRRLKIDQTAPNQIRYRLLIMQGGKGDQQFVGSLQLVVNTLVGGKNAMMNFPAANSAEQEKFKLSFKHYQRVEGVLTLPEGATTRLVQARVLERGLIRAQVSANL
ncbi:MAG TPA: DUF6776 family protein [Noviherbaspirillum sp.]|uniref:DUF6776 family protein n=1 Tax=Noviherbaspirillum sp. TaxID=1926288 RepID=UPI002B45C505|nr:DUF6776 family protein [Noviherbaspirillum sp.]HJV84837.1 DUF6776 family protein [Noviherbaspirillum sp.]